MEDPSTLETMSSQKIVQLRNCARWIPNEKEQNNINTIQYLLITQIYNHTKVTSFTTILAQSPFPKHQFSSLLLPPQIQPTQIGGQIPVVYIKFFLFVDGTLTSSYARIHIAEKIKESTMELSQQIGFVVGTCVNRWRRRKYFNMMSEITICNYVHRCKYSILSSHN